MSLRYVCIESVFVCALCQLNLHCHIRANALTCSCSTHNGCRSVQVDAAQPVMGNRGVWKRRDQARGIHGESLGRATADAVNAVLRDALPLAANKETEAFRDEFQTLKTQLDLTENMWLFPDLNRSVLSHSPGLRALPCSLRDTLCAVQGCDLTRTLIGAWTLALLTSAPYVRVALCSTMPGAKWSLS